MSKQIMRFIHIKNTYGLKIHKILENILTIINLILKS